MGEREKMGGAGRGCNLVVFGITVIALFDGGEVHDLVGVGFFGFEIADEFAAAHDQNAVGDAE